MVAPTPVDWRSAEMVFRASWKPAMTATVSTTTRARTPAPYPAVVMASSRWGKPATMVMVRTMMPVAMAVSLPSVETGSPAGTEPQKKRVTKSVMMVI